MQRGILISLFLFCFSSTFGSLDKSTTRKPLLIKKPSTKQIVIPIHPHSTEVIVTIDKMDEKLRSLGLWCACNKPYCPARIKMYSIVNKFQNSMATENMLFVQ